MKIRNGVNSPFCLETTEDLTVVKYSKFSTLSAVIV